MPSKKSTSFVKVDVNTSYNETVLKRWTGPLPRLMKVSSLASYGIGEYNVNALSDKHNRGAESEMSFSPSTEIKVKIPKQDWKDGGDDILGNLLTWNSIRVKLLNTKMRSGSSKITNS